jgi:RNA polymerase sigma-70 factor (ECF subfamily)
MHTTSTSLLQQLRQPGEEQAWDRLVELYAPLLHYWLRKAGLGYDDAADLVQEVFATLVQKLPDFAYDREKSFRGWLRTITLNKWRDRMRLKAEPADLRNEPDREMPVPDGLEAFWEEEHRQHLVGRALQIMREQFESTTWRACWEFVVNDRSASEVAAELGISENAVYIAKWRVVRRLRHDLQGLLEE